MGNKKFCAHGMVPQACLKCKQNFAAALMATARVGRGGHTGVARFEITEIPNVMDKLDGVQGPLFMRRWFDGDAYELPLGVKTGKVDARTLNKIHVKEDLPFDWMEQSPRLGPIVQETVDALSEANEFNDLVGKVKSPLDQLSRGLIVLMIRLEKLGLLDTKRKTLVDGSRFFGDLPAIELDYATQFNRVDVGVSTWEKVFDDLDDVYFALGAFSIKLAATQFRTYSNLNGFAAIDISEVGLYIRDTYDFLNSDGKDQLLGYWNTSGVIKPNLAEYLMVPDRIDHWFKTYFRVRNSDYNAYRRRTGKGGDFMVFSTVKRVPVSIMVHLSTTDIEEYLDRKSD